jgi:RNA polymerase sigma-70 factor (ECF subfamily)
MSFFDGRRDRLDAFRVGDRQVLSELFHFYVDEVAALVRHGFRAGAALVPGAADIENDLVQEVFIRAFAESARRAFNPLLPYKPYLLRIARNLLIDEARRRGRWQTTEVKTEELEQAQPLPESAEDELSWRTLRDATIEFCRSLSGEQREFVRLRFESGLSQRDVAESMHVTRRRVRTLEDATTAALKAWLAARGLA